MQPSLDMERIAQTLGAERRGRVAPGAGYFGAVQLAAEVMARFRVSDGEGRPTDPASEEQRLIRLSATTLGQLERLAVEAHATPMQLAALLLEQAVQTAALADRPAA